MMDAQRASIAGRLREISCAPQRGCITAICGPNGAGKSSLLQVLAGLLVPDAGTARAATLDPRDRARRIGYLPQDGEVAWDVSVRNLVALGRLPHRDARREPVDEAIAALELGALADRPVSRLSGGERARALLARVLAGEPEWILADEPLAALDLAHQLRLVAHLRRAAAAGAGVVLVVHDLAIAMNHADRALVLEGGALVADGPPQTSLSEATIARVWGVDASWLGEEGARALVAR